MSKFNCRLKHNLRKQLVTEVFGFIRVEILTTSKNISAFLIEQIPQFVNWQSNVFLVDMDVLHSCACCCVTIRSVRYIKAKCKFTRKKDSAEHFMRGQTICFIVAAHEICLDHRSSQVSHWACSIMFKKPSKFQLFVQFCDKCGPRKMFSFTYCVIQRWSYWIRLSKSRFKRYICKLFSTPHLSPTLL